MGGEARILTVVNQKGGVGKTTTAVNLAATLSLSERSILLVDLDPQANASSAYGCSNPAQHIYHALIGERPARELITPTELPFLHLLPSGTDLVGAEIELVFSENREYQLRAALEPLRGLYDVIVLDCPPSLGLLTLNALAAANGVLVPLQCEYYALEGLARLLDTIKLVKAKLNPGLELDGIILTMMDARNNLSRQVEREVREHFGERVLDSVIPRNVRLSEAPSYGKPIILYDVHSSGAAAYLRLGEEVLRRMALDHSPKRPPLVGPVAIKTDPNGSVPIDMGG